MNLVKAGQVGGIKDDVEAVLRLPALTRGIADLQEVRLQVESEISSEGRKRTKMRRDAAKARALQIEINDLHSKLERKEDTFDRTKSRFDNLEKELKGKEEAMEHIKNIQFLRAQRDALSTTLERSAKRRHEKSSNAWKVLIWERAGDVYEKANEQYTNIQSSRYKLDSIENKINRLTREMEEFTGFCSHCDQPIKDAAAHNSKLNEELLVLQNELSQVSSDTGLSVTDVSTIISDLGKLNPPSGSRKIIIQSNDDWIEDRSKLLNLIENLEKEEGRGLQGVDGSELAEKWEELGKMRSSLKSLEPSIGDLKDRIKAKELEVKRLGGGNTSTTDIHKRNVNSTIGNLLNVMKDTLAKYRDNARKEVEAVASESFRNVINAPEALTGIIIDKNFNGSILGADGRRVTMPSSGQEMTMTLCIMDALRRVSNVSAPIFFDTPGRSLDDDHKKAQLEYFWNMREHQFIIFPHSGEYKIEETIDEFGGLIGSAWELTWPADRENCEKCGEDSPIKEGVIMRCLNCEHKWDISVRQTTVNVLEV